MYYIVINYPGADMGVAGIRLQPDIENPLEKLAKKLDRSINYFINQAINVKRISQDLTFVK